ncbi:MAG TPA: hypothetical protein VMP10_02980, partial [Chloroflexota bacterium]|nr:hypothetical protein [Chloroflexota bacterium]
MRLTVRVLIGLTFALALIATPAFAKKAPDSLLIEGGGLASPVEIDDASKLEEFSPWSRGFVDWARRVPLNEPAVAATPYTVSFFLEERKIYVVEYVPGPDGEGYVYFPNGSHPAFDLNMSTIITGDSDHWNPNGKWAYATQEWVEVIERALT